MGILQVVLCTISSVIFIFGRILSAKCAKIVPFIAIMCTFGNQVNLISIEGMLFGRVALI
jgi:hypothetical protein